MVLTQLVSRSLGDRKAPWLVTLVHFSTTGLGLLWRSNIGWSLASVMLRFMALVESSEVCMVLSDPSRNTDQGV